MTLVELFFAVLTCFALGAACAAIISHESA